SGQRTWPASVLFTATSAATCGTHKSASNCSIQPWGFKTTKRFWNGPTDFISARAPPSSNLIFNMSFGRVEQEKSTMPWSLVARSESTSEPNTHERTNPMQQPPAGVATQANGGDTSRISVMKPPQACGTRNHLYLLGLCSVAALGGFLFGFDSGV